MAISTATITLDALGNVPQSYRHEWRVATPQQPLLAPGALFKWYQIHREGSPVPEAWDEEARQTIAAALAQGAWTPSYGLNFAILHVTPSHAYLLACVWRGHNELWERLYVKDLTANGPFERVATDGEDAPVGCVWEMAATCHERMAWHRYLFTARTQADKRAWLEDVYAGPA